MTSVPRKKTATGKGIRQGCCINNFLKKSDQSQNYVLNEGDCLYLTSNGKIDIGRDIMPFISGAYMVSEIKNND